MCLLSLIFGGLLWPVALIWANYDHKKDKTPAPDLAGTDAIVGEKDKAPSTDLEGADAIVGNEAFLVEEKK